MYVQQIVSKKTEPSESVIIKIHSLVLMDRPEDRGIYRSIPVSIMGANHEPTPPYLVPVRMERITREMVKDRNHIRHRRLDQVATEAPNYPEAYGADVTNTWEERLRSYPGRAQGQVETE